MRVCCWNRCNSMSGDITFLLMSKFSTSTSIYSKVFSNGRLNGPFIMYADYINGLELSFVFSSNTPTTWDSKTVCSLPRHAFFIPRFLTIAGRVLSLYYETVMACIGSNFIPRFLTIADRVLALHLILSRDSSQLLGSVLALYYEAVMSCILTIAGSVLAL